MGAYCTPGCRHLKQVLQLLLTPSEARALRLCHKWSFTDSPSRLSKSDFDLLVMRSTDIQKPEGLKSTISLFYYCSESNISVFHQWLSKGLIPLCMSIAMLLSIKNCADRDKVREKGCADFLTWFVGSSLASNASIKDLQAYFLIGIQHPHSLVILHPVQKSRLSSISQSGDHKPPPSAFPAPLRGPDFLSSRFTLWELSYFISPTVNQQQIRINVSLTHLVHKAFIQYKSSLLWSWVQLE